MRLGLVGRKVGMTRVFTEEGQSVPVTVIDVSNNRVAQVKTQATDGYASLQVAFGDRKVSRTPKAMQGHFAKAGITAAKEVHEFALTEEQVAGFSLGQVLKAEETFTVGNNVDVSGITKGRGFSGAIRRHNFSSNRASHGNSRSHNSAGSIGQAQDPGRVFPGKKMAGHYGDVQRTVQNLEVVRIDTERQLLLIKGGIPGATNGTVVVTPAVKSAA
jgi:large subunit ribosomal protein L3